MSISNVWSDASTTYTSPEEMQSAFENFEWENQLYRETGIDSDPVGSPLISGGDGNQWSEGNCSVVAALQGVADRDPQKVYDMIKPHRNADGVLDGWDVTLYDKMGNKVTVHVTAEEVSTGSRYDGQLWNPAQREDVWVNVLSVAIDKQFGKDYPSALDENGLSTTGGLHGDRALFMIYGVEGGVGGKGFGIPPAPGESRTSWIDYSQTQLNKGEVVLVAFGSEDNSVPTTNGIGCGHTYEVTDIYIDPETNERMVVLRNPYGDLLDPSDYPDGYVREDGQIVMSEDVLNAHIDGQNSNSVWITTTNSPESDRFTDYEQYTEQQSDQLGTKALP